MRKLFPAIILLGSGLAAPAAADLSDSPDCGAELSGAVYEMVNDIRSGSAGLDDKLASFDAAAQKCPGNAFAQHYAALAHFTRAQELNQTKAGAAAIYEEVQKAFARSQAYWALDERHQTFSMQGDSKLINVGIPASEPTDLRRDMVTVLLNLHLKAGLSHPYVTSDTTPDCTGALFWDVSAAQGLFTDDPSSRRSLVAFAERIAAGCPLDTPGRATTLMHRNLASMQMSLAEDVVESDPDLARQKLERIKAYRDGVLRPGETDNLNWYEVDSARLMRIESMLPARVDIPTDQDSPLISAGPLPVED